MKKLKLFAVLSRYQTMGRITVEYLDLNGKLVNRLKVGMLSVREKTAIENVEQVLLRINISNVIWTVT